MKKRLAFVMAALLAAGTLCSCGRVIPKDTQVLTPPEAGPFDISLKEENFAAELFKTAYKESGGDNTLLSPMSVYAALSMLYNGSQGYTLCEIESLLCGETDAINEYFAKYTEGLAEDEVSTVSMADSVWIADREDIEVQKSFIKTVQKYYNAEIFESQSLEAEADKINEWASQKTNGMIDSVLNKDDIDESTVVMLLNAMAFDGKWVSPFEISLNTEDNFENYDGSKTETTFMSSEESDYIETDNAVGFIKHYSGGDSSRYCFIALLPNEDIGIDKYIEQYLDGDTFSDAAEAARDVSVYVRLPKFEFDSSYDLSETLKSMGMKRAFDEQDAELMRLAEVESFEESNVYVSSVLHKAHIDLDEEGTKAEAVTVITNDVWTGAAAEDEPQYIDFDRPFLFAVYDKQEEIPIFIGTLMDVSDGGENVLPNVE